MKIEAVIFDMDGVLVDTEPFYMYRVKQFLDSHHINVSMQDVYRLAGSSQKETFEIMQSWWPTSISIQELKSMYQQATQLVRVQDIYPYILQPYTKIILRQLSEKGIPLAIASASNKVLIDSMCTSCGIDSYFSFKQSGEDLQRSKPYPDIYLEVAKQLQVNPKNCIVVEDSTYGIRAAKDAGMYVIAKEDKRFHYDQSPADICGSDLFEIYTIIKNKLNEEK